MPDLQIIREKYVTTAVIRRPEAMNAINFELMKNFETLLDKLETKDELRLFILTGSDNSFISGGDLRGFHSIKHAEGAKEMTQRMISILQRIENLKCWTLAAINGHTYGGGWEIMLSFDFRVALSNVKIGFTQGKFYLPPGWGGITKLTNTVGRNLALYWLASRKIIDAETARKNGLIQDIFESYEYDDKLDALKKSLIHNDRAFIEYLKRKDLKHAADEVDPFSRFWESEEHLRRVDEFLSRKEL